ncbi:MAG: SET domain-containing protein [Saprospiraceae bacterium]|nr:SET domain-containing protein [Saprospiraceae bacterium]
MFTKSELLAELSCNTFVCLKPSPLHGIGVFAIIDIPKDCKNLFSTEQGEWHTLSMQEFQALPSHARHLVETYCLFDENTYYVPAGGFKQMDLSLFLNHSDLPNIASVNEGEYFVSLREIAIGEELLVDYGTIVEE